MFSKFTKDRVNKSESMSNNVTDLIYFTLLFSLTTSLVRYICIYRDELQETNLHPLSTSAKTNKQIKYTNIQTRIIFYLGPG